MKPASLLFSRTTPARVPWSRAGAAFVALFMAATSCGVTWGRAETKTVEGDRELGEYLSAECVTCHQLSGRYDGIPVIIGFDPAYFIEVLTDYREHRRENAVMRNIAAKLSDEEMAALAVYFASIQPTQ
jgi:cytochrome c553